jgi:hypothetical protein
MWTKPAALAVLSILGLWTSTPSYAQNIEFVITSSARIDVRCHGPWLRTSQCAQIAGNNIQHSFYKAEDNGLDPYGAWRCSIYNHILAPSAAMALLPR